MLYKTKYLIQQTKYSVPKDLVTSCYLVSAVQKDNTNVTMICISNIPVHIPGGPPPPEKNTEHSIFQDFALINRTLYFFTLLDRASFPHYNNTEIIKFDWKLFILWVISYGLSFSGFARFPEFRGTINESFGRPYIDRVLCSVIHVLPTDLHTTLPNKDLQSRQVISL